MSTIAATSGMSIHPSVQGQGHVTTTTATVGTGPNSIPATSTVMFPNGVSGVGTTTGQGVGTAGQGQTIQVTPSMIGGAVAHTSGYMNVEPFATQKDLNTLMKYFNSILSGMVLLSNETEDTKQVLTVEEGFTMFAKYQNLGHKVTVTMLSGEAAKILYGQQLK